MKNRIHFIPIVLLFSMLMTSCFSDVTIDIEEEKSLLVMNAWLIAGDSPKVSIYASKSIFESGNYEKLSNVNLLLFEGDRQIAILTQDENGDYVNDQLVIKENTDYTFKATHSNYPNAEASITVPDALYENNIQLKHNVVAVEDYGYVYNQSDLVLTIEDKEASEDYYAISVLNKYVQYDEYYMEDTIRSNSLGGSLTSLDPQVDYLYVGYGQVVGIRDEFFNGGTYQNTFSSYNDLRFYESDTASNYYYKESNTVIIYKFSKILYQYFLTLGNNQYPEAFTEPSQVFSNVEGGYGVVGAASSFAVPIEEKRVDIYYRF